MLFRSELLINRTPVNNYAYSMYVCDIMDALNTLGTGPREVQGGTANVTLDWQANKLIFHDPGDYIMAVNVNAGVGNVVTGFNLTHPVVGSWTTATPGFWATSSAFYTLSPAGAGSQDCNASYAFRINTPGTELLWGYSQTAASTGIGDFQITRLPHGSVAPVLSFNSLFDAKAQVKRTKEWADRPTRTFSLGSNFKQWVSTNGQARPPLEGKALTSKPDLDIPEPKIGPDGNGIIRVTQNSPTTGAQPAIHDRPATGTPRPGAATGQWVLTPNPPKPESHTLRSPQLIESTI